MRLEEMILHQVEAMYPVWHDRGERTNMCERPRHGIVIVQSGSYIYTQGETEVLSDPAHVIYLPKGATYSSRCMQADCSLLINFECNLKNMPLCSFPVNCGTELVLLAKQLETESGELRRKSLMYELLARIRESAANTAYGTHVIRRGVEYLESHFCDPELNMSDAAQQAAVSTVYFRKCFTEAYGMPPLRYVQQLRMRKAQHLLCERKQSVEQIALNCGYKSVYSFSNAFHRLTGFSPTGYIRVHSTI